LADLLGHDYQGHVILNALVHTRVTTVAEVAELSEVDLLDVRHLGPARIALIRQRLTRTTTEGRR
jgi:DNA-directed RNA polymerase alpha subunit